LIDVNLTKTTAQETSYKETFHRIFCINLNIDLNEVGVSVKNGSFQVILLASIHLFNDS